MLAIWGWFSAHSGKIGQGFRWVRKQLNLNTQNADLTKQVATEQELTQSLTARAEKAEAERDVLAKRLEPPERRPEPQERILLLLMSMDGLRDQEIAARLKMGEQVARYHITELNTSKLIRLIPLLGPNPMWHLSDAGRKYLHSHGLLQ